MALDALDRVDDAEQPQKAAPASGDFLTSDSLDRLDNVETVFALATTPGPSQTIGPITVGYAPGANAAFSITPGTLDSQNNFTAGPVTYGPYAAVVTSEGGAEGLSYALTVTTSDATLSNPLSGAVSIQPGDLLAGVFTADGDPIIGTLSPASSPSAPAMTTYTAGQPVFGIVSSEDTILAGSEAVVSVLITPQTPVDGETPTDPVTLNLTLILSGSGLAEGISFTGTWLTVADGQYAGIWAQAVLTAATTLALGGSACSVIVQIGGTTNIQASGVLRFLQP